LHNIKRKTKNISNSFLLSFIPTIIGVPPF
jgi:hypothetical protein